MAESSWITLYKVADWVNGEYTAICIFTTCSYSINPSFHFDTEYWGLVITTTSLDLEGTEFKSQPRDLL
jgi:hypothetical protein